MGIELRLPNIKGTDKEQLVQIRSYLYQLTEQLQWALNNAGTPSTNYMAPQPQRAATASLDAKDAFDALKPFIIKSADIVNAYYEEISSKFKEDYLAKFKSWVGLGLSEGVAESEADVGRCGGTGCYYRVCADQKHIYVAFNCAFTYSGNAIQVNADPIPSEYRPDRDIYAICAADGRAFARILVNKDGNVIVDSIQEIASVESTTSSAVKWIDGYIDYFLQEET